MLILIAESKTMETREVDITSELYAANIPQGESEASEIMLRLRDMSIDDLATTIKISTSMASRLQQMIYEFPNKRLGLKSIKAFTGVVFRNIDYSSLSSDEKTFADSKVRIISSLYGWLKPSDIIKPYRFEYTSPVAPDNKPLSSYWRKAVTMALINTIHESGETEILDLLPSDAAKCIDWKQVRTEAKVWKVDFKELTGENVRSPHAGKLKACRGKLLREIIINHFETINDLTSFESDVMFPIENYEHADRLGFYV